MESNYIKKMKERLERMESVKPGDHLIVQYKVTIPTRLGPCESLARTIGYVLNSDNPSILLLGPEPGYIYRPLSERSGIIDALFGHSDDPRTAIPLEDIVSINGITD